MQVLFKKYIECCNVFSLPYDFLKNILFSLACFIERIQYIVHITCKVCVQLFMLSVSVLVNSRLFVVKFLESQKLHADFQLRVWESVLLTPALFKGQLCC